MSRARDQSWSAWERFRRWKERPDDSRMRRIRTVVAAQHKDDNWSWLSTTMLRRVCGRGEKFAKLWTARVSSVQHSGRCHDVEMKEVGWLVGRFRGADFVCSSMFPGCSHGCSHFVGGPCVRMFSLHGFHFVLRHFVFDICRFLSLESLGNY